MISLIDVSKIYPSGNVAIENISLQLNQGDFLFVAGASGAGKSTFLKLLSAEIKATSGYVGVLGKDLSKLKKAEIQKLLQEVSFIFQDYKLIESLTIWENVSYALETKFVPADQRRDLAANILKAFQLENRLDAYPRMLSGGEQQRIAVARALITKPKLILADEPTGNLDTEMTHAIFDLLLQANAAGVTVVVATHNLNIIESLNLRTVVLEQGRIIGDFAQPGGVL